LTLALPETPLRLGLGANSNPKSGMLSSTGSESGLLSLADSEIGLGLGSGLGSEIGILSHTHSCNGMSTSTDSWSGILSSTGLESGLLTPQSVDEIPCDIEIKHRKALSILETEMEGHDFPVIRIAIEDSGIGISDETRVILFQPFKQAQRLATGGTGLGLYSLSNRIKALNGSRGILSREDGKNGSVFWFTIPYRPDSQATPDCEPIKMLPPDGRKMKFLVVYDANSNLKVVSRSLVNKNHLVETACNGSDGLDRLVTAYPGSDFDCALFDLQMPIMDGIEAVTRYREFEHSKWLKKKELGSTTPLKKLLVIGMSANSDNVTKECALAAGMDAFLAKPFVMAELHLLVANLLLRQESQEGL
jgi:CheY-like chemotaxis protein